MTERHHFLIEPQRINENEFSLNGSEGHHLKNVVRLKVGDEIFLLDQKGNAYRSVIEEVGNQITGHVEEIIPDYNSPSIKLHLAVGLLKGNKMVEIVKRAAELGVTSITPLSMKHSVKKGVNRERLKRVMESAQKQSGQGKAPKLNATVSLDDWCKTIPVQNSAYAHPSPEALPLNSWLQSAKDADDVWLLVGPEGGFHKEEIAVIEEFGIPAVSLGWSRLRSETAATAAAAITLEYFHARRSNG